MAPKGPRPASSWRRRSAGASGSLGNMHGAFGFHAPISFRVRGQHSNSRQDVQLPHACLFCASVCNDGTCKKASRLNFQEIRKAGQLDFREIKHVAPIPIRHLFEKIGYLGLQMFLFAILPSLTSTL